ncbi:hypothetical protein SNEBB_008206 [Seison nebaliae]|nr:hypothetical protein SNEBB_008206 [Seison nebaliae]
MSDLDDIPDLEDPYENKESLFDEDGLRIKNENKNCLNHEKVSTTTTKTSNALDEGLLIREIQNKNKEEESKKRSEIENMQNKLYSSNEQFFSQIFQDPEMVEAIDLFQKDPELAKTKYGRNEKITQMMVSATKLMGNVLFK